jgi:hypothetical protein
MFKNKNKLYNSDYLSNVSIISNRCNYINPKTNKHCKNHLGLYPQFCFIHTLLINNVFISKSHIKNAGNGVFAGPDGFKKNSIIGIYSSESNKTTQQNVIDTCHKTQDNSCWEYVLCNLKKKHQKDSDVICWDAIDKKSTLMRYINDAYKTKYKNNSYFHIKKKKNTSEINQKWEFTAYVIASKNINPYEEIFVDYGKNYWS